jgi:hypothetical protein
MRSPAVKTLIETFQLSRADAKLIKKLTQSDNDADALAQLIENHCPATHVYATQCHGNPYDSHMWRVTMILHAVDRILGTHGIEGLAPEGDRFYPYGPPYEYCNTGDTYATTLIYKRDTNHLFIGNWGDIAERFPHSNWDAA